MGASFCTVFEAEVAPHGTLGGDNTAVLRRMARLDRLAEDHGLTPLGAFVSYDPADVADFLGEEDLEGVGEMPAVQWFDAAAGLAAVEALRAHLAAHPKAVPGQAEVDAELQAIAAELAAARTAGVRFRFMVVP